MTTGQGSRCWAFRGAGRDLRTRPLFQGPRGLSAARRGSQEVCVDVPSALLEAIARAGELPEAWSQRAWESVERRTEGFVNSHLPPGARLLGAEFDAERMEVRIRFRRSHGPKEQRR